MEKLQSENRGLREEVNRCKKILEILLEMIKVNE